jgi:hypothetical protein
MKEFIVTFGWGHMYRDVPMRHKFTRIQAETKEEASKKARSVFGNKWSMIYPTEKDAGVPMFNLEYFPFPSEEDIE